MVNRNCSASCVSKSPYELIFNGTNHIHTVTADIERHKIVDELEREKSNKTEQIESLNVFYVFGKVVCVCY